MFLSFFKHTVQFTKLNLRRYPAGMLPSFDFQTPASPQSNLPPVQICNLNHMFLSFFKHTVQFTKLNLR
ncbi:MAG: hypothetical protein ABIE14_04790, partial [Patescibacteria group bacterium]